MRRSEAINQQRHSQRHWRLNPVRCAVHAAAVHSAVRPAALRLFHARAATLWVASCSPVCERWRCAPDPDAPPMSSSQPQQRAKRRRAQVQARRPRFAASRTPRTRASLVKRKPRNSDPGAVRRKKRATPHRLKPLAAATAAGDIDGVASLDSWCVCVAKGGACDAVRFPR